MDVIVLTKFLAPFLPFLMNVGNKVFDSAITKAGEDAWGKAKAVWAKLQPKVATKPAALEAATDVANAPEEEDLQVALRVQLKKLLEQDEVLAQEIARIMQGNAQGNSGDKVVQNVTGENNQTLGSVQGSKVVRDVSGDVTM
jgi:hypothetical protein